MWKTKAYCGVTLRWTFASNNKEVWALCFMKIGWVLRKMWWVCLFVLSEYRHEIPWTLSFKSRDSPPWFRRWRYINILPAIWFTCVVKRCTENFVNNIPKITEPISKIIWQQPSEHTTSKWRLTDVASTLIGRYYDVMCQPGKFLFFIFVFIYQILSASDSIPYISTRSVN